MGNAAETNGVDQLCRFCRVELAVQGGLCRAHWANMLLRRRYGLHVTKRRHHGNGEQAISSSKLRTPQPTAYLPGTEEKLAVLIARAANGERLFHPADASGKELFRW